MTAHAITIVPYAGFRSETRLFLRARILRHAAPRAVPRTSWQKFRAMARLYASREVAGCEIALDFGPLDATAISDAEGYVVFDLAIEPDLPLPRHSRWEDATLNAIDCPCPDGPADALILAPGTDIHHGVISDLDDTVLETGVWNLARNWRRVLASNPDDRIAVPGVEDLFTHIGGGAGGKADESASVRSPSRPFFYISSSPWNLYGFLTEFLSLNNLPLGPMKLKDWGFNRKTLGSKSHGDHKTRAIAALLEFYPRLKFILIGDDSQGDVAAYADAVVSHPGRVAAVLIRHVHATSFTPQERDAIAAIRHAGVPVWTGSAFDVGEDMLASLNLSTSTEVEQVAKTLDKAEVEHDAPLAPKPPGA